VTAVNLERHRAPALWLVTAAIVATVVTAVVVGPRTASAVVVATLALSAVARLALRGRRPEGVAVRATWVDVLVLTALAVGIAAFAGTPGV